MQLWSDGKRWTFAVFLLICLFTLGAIMVMPADAAETGRVARGSMAPVQSTIRSIRDQIQRENYASGAMASPRYGRQSKR
jgi:hypothetical protein